MRTSINFIVFLLLGIFASCQSATSVPADSRGIAAVDLLLADMRGASHAVDELLAGGQLVTLVFWQTWCSSCLEEAPELASAAREMEGEMQFIGVVSGPDRSVDEVRIDELVESLGIPYPQIRDRDLSLAKAFGVEATPTIIVLGAGRKILYRGHRALGDWSSLMPDS